MKSRLSHHCRPGLLLFLASVRALATWAPVACGADLDAKFVEALDERGWHDTAARYIEWAADKPTVSREFLALAPFYKATALMAQAEKSVVRSEREAAFREATEALATFAKARPQSAQAVEALRKLAYGRMELAQAEAGRAEQTGPLSAERPAVIAARGAYDEAYEAATTLTDHCRGILAGLPKAAATAVGSDASKMRTLVSSGQAEGEFLAALARFESARLYEPQSSEAKRAIGDALQLFRKLTEEHRSSTVGFSSQYYQGRCHQLAGDFDKALGAYEAVVGLPTPNEEWRQWQARAHQYRTECLVAAGKVDTAILDAADWLERARQEERNRPEWLGVAYELCRARLAKAKSLDPDDNAAKRLTADARAGLVRVAETAGPLQRPAKALLASLGEKGEKQAEVRTFAEALAAGRSAVEMMNSSNLAARLAADNNPEAVGELTEQAHTHQRAALGYLKQALSLAQRDTPADDLNAARYYLCWLYWEEGRWLEAAVLGEDLALKHRESSYAAGGAGVALRAFEKILAGQTAAKEPLSPALVARQSELCEAIAATWPDSDDAAAAMNLLIARALQAEDVPAAEALIGRLPPEGRATAEMSLGASLWAKYCLQASGGMPSDSEAAKALRERAASFLDRGYKDLNPKAKPSAATAAAILSLAQLRQAGGDARGALDVLEAKPAGPLQLIADDSSAAANPRFVEESYKTALSAYLTVDPPQPERAQEIMEALEKAVAGGESQAQLTRLYVGLGVQLQKQLKTMQAAGENAKAKALAATFTELLQRVGERSGKADWKTQLWLAQSNQQIGEGLAAADAATYFKQAEKAYRAMLALGEKGGADAPPKTELPKVRKLLGDCLRGQSKYAEALALYAEVLRERTALLDLQQAAAATLEQQGISQRDADALNRSIQGDLAQPNGKKLIWGWLQLAKTVEGARRVEVRTNGADSPKAAQFADVFFEARYHAARARLEAGKLATGADRAKQLATVRQTVEAMKSLYPDLGGPKWKNSFEQLARDAEAAKAK